jgi:hypothetical protein
MSNLEDNIKRHRELRLQSIAWEKKQAIAKAMEPQLRMETKKQCTSIIKSNIDMQIKREDTGPKEGRNMLFLFRMHGEKSYHR